MSYSSILSLPYIQSNQAQKHVTHNEALRTLDVLVQLTVSDATTSTPPPAPNEGDRYIVGPAATGDWNSHDGEIAVFSTNGWIFYLPQPGWHADVLSLGSTLRFDGQDWQTTDPDFQEISLLGINAAADTTNKLTCSAAATLLTHDGAGHQLKINKKSASDTASLIFQTSWSGRVEIGTVETDALSIKTSSNGTDWTTSIHIDPTNGYTTFPAGGVRQMITMPLVCYVDPSAGDDDNNGTTPATALASVEYALNRLKLLDGGGKEATLHLMDGTHTLTNTLEFGPCFVGFSAINLIGNMANPDQVKLTTDAEYTFFMEAGKINLQGLRLENTAPNTHTTFYIRPNAEVFISDLAFSAVNTSHFNIVGGRVQVNGDYSIEGDAVSHIFCTAGGTYYAANRNISLINSPNLSFFANVQESSSVGFRNCLFSGDSTGRRFSVSSNGVLNTFGETDDFLPGNVVGVTRDGGQYV